MIRFVQFCDIVSPHQMPLARELASRFGSGEYLYLYTEASQVTRANLGWELKSGEDWCQLTDFNDSRLLECECLLTGFRLPGLFRKRAEKGLRTFYMSERWFKPPIGMVRLLHPGFLKMAIRMVRLLKSDPSVVYLPMGVHAQKDMLRLGVPLSKMLPWGYFVAPSKSPLRGPPQDGPGSCLDEVKILWVGRMLKLKCVDTLVRAVAEANELLRGLKQRSISLTLVGDGPEKSNLIRLAESLNLQESVISFLPSVPISRVRDLMQKHDVYVFPSNGRDGWGAVVSEALEEGMLVLGSNEAGATATILPSTHRFNCHDHRRLAKLLVEAVSGRLAHTPIGEWTAAKAADRLMARIGQNLNGMG